eukprot:scaffold262_cov230-Pinguiococcus_pyrenoidosus.AAC.22
MQSTLCVEVKERITDLCVTPDGQFVFTAASSGIMRATSLQQPSWSCVLYHFEAKGLHTALLLRSLIAEDGSFVFAGASRGCTEVIAMDLRGLARRNVQSELKRRLHIRADTKLKGIGAVTRVSPTEWRLFCGLGIKSIHVWRFEVRGGEASWTLLVASQSAGMTNEFAGFRRGGLEAVCKSDGACIRVWDLEEAAQRPRHFDVPNTIDAKAITEALLFGGFTHLSTVSFSADASLNRCEILLPDQQGSGGGASRSRRRSLRAITDIEATSDGADALITCSDGAVLRYVHDMAHPKVHVISDQAKAAHRHATSSSNPVLWRLQRLRLINVVVAASFCWDLNAKSGWLEISTMSSSSSTAPRKRPRSEDARDVQHKSKKLHPSKKAAAQQTPKAPPRPVLADRTNAVVVPRKKRLSVVPKPIQRPRRVISKEPWRPPKRSIVTLDAPASEKLASCSRSSLVKDQAVASSLQSLRTVADQDVLRLQDFVISEGVRLRKQIVLKRLGLSTKTPEGLLASYQERVRRTLEDCKTMRLLNFQRFPTAALQAFISAVVAWSTRPQRSA